MRDNDENPMHNMMWPSGVQPLWPAFSAKTPKAVSIHDDDTIAVSLGGRAPQQITCSRFRSLVKDGRLDGIIYIGLPDGTVTTATFAEFRASVFGPAGYPGPVAGGAGSSASTSGPRR